MSTLEFRDYEILSANLGDENCMADIGNIEYIRTAYIPSPTLSEEDARNIGKGRIRTLLPYTQQDHYDRSRSIRAFHAAILENERLRAVFLPELGGRLWSLYDKVLDRELLYVNPIFQPANLGLRNAWFSGGVEFNIGIRGHNPLTCSPMHALRMVTADGQPALRMYEYERIRGLAYSIDALLPEGSDTLYLRVNIENTADTDTYTYWWSNIAVPETPHTRVLVPASDALVSLYTERGHEVGLAPIPYPNGDDVDCTYPVNGKTAKDYFFRIPNDHRKWVAAAEADGKGLLQFSTHELIGRKLFIWGQGRGGRNWNRWLCGEDFPYVEIQAGLARSQFEHLPMAAKSSISWVEGYTALNCAPDALYGSYPDAISAVDAYLDGKRCGEAAMHSLFDGITPVETLMNGSGWGHIENLLRKVCGKDPISAFLPFPEESVGKTEELWRTFLTTGTMPAQDLSAPPASFLVDANALPLYEKQIAAGKAHAALWLHYGTALYANDRAEDAYKAFEQSNALVPNAWALRNLSMLEKNVRGNLAKAMDYMEQALALDRSCRGLILNAAQLMLEYGANERCIELYHSLNSGLRAESRLQLYAIIALIRTQQYEAAAAMLSEDFLLSDIVEGELSLSHVWYELYRNLVTGAPENATTEELNRLVDEQFPLPAQLDFRMS